MTTLFWDRPVRVGEIMIMGPLNAYDFMTSSWPLLKDSHFIAASEAILAALDGRGSPDLARERFEMALASAELAVDG